MPGSASLSTSQHSSSPRGTEWDHRAAPQSRDRGGVGGGGRPS
eukprot:CAMPEP_0113594438 /NCGR_PEP_ID=MMETSP0015_2-20120614/39086_1 /TAXON_ID=2838 /ORGANISM="Odontella" /LENGTH=42 /DNA_ID=CAMNT_0000501453 /DNA_START=482 /DNA_END=607 /DNA_ORIENTATION=+ /assembly_acc=CAM_ASM_000160